MLNKSFHLDSLISSKSEAEDGTITVRGYANTTSKDRVGDVIVKEAWRTESALTNYLKNPIILAYHDRAQPIGQMVDYSVTDKGLEIVAEISKSAGVVYDLVKEGILKAFSVGFRVKDADYDADTDIFVIKDLELHEVSVVSIPANADSLFSLAKGFDGSNEEFEAFKSQYVKNDAPMTGAKDDTIGAHLEQENKTMDENQIKEMMAEVAKKTAADIAMKQAETAAKAKATAEAATKAAAEAEAQKAAIIEMGQTGAERLVKELEARITEKQEDAMTVMSEMKNEIAEKAAEIEALRSNKMEFSDHAGTKGFEVDYGQFEVAALTASLLGKQLGETEHGREMLEKAGDLGIMLKAGGAATSLIGGAQSGQISSTDYEHIISNNIEKEVQENLVVAPLFREIKLNAAQMTLPIAPDAAKADWVGTGTYGTDATTGAEKTVTLSEIYLTTAKMASKTFMIDEFDEDSIIAMMPLLKDSLVRGHARKVEEQLLAGDTGAGDPFMGLTNIAVKGGTTVAAGTEVKALDILKLRRELGKYGLNTNGLACVVSQNTYWDLLQDTEFADVNLVGADNATKLNGQVGTVFGMAVIVSPEMPNVTTAGSTWGVMVDKANFLMPRQRGFNVQSEYYVEKQSRVLVATQRFGFKQIIAGSGTGAGNLSGGLAVGTFA
jgi:HK97 family phage prohead protease/HK97 family phage major capsid protein